jgi:hypothetical protein
MEMWKKVWREGLAPLLSATELETLRRGLVRDDRRLIQRSTCCPPPSEVFHEEAVEGACALGYCGWQAERLETVAEVEQFFIQTCVAADERLGEPAACRYFLNWFDETPRADMRRSLLAEVNRALNQRHGVAA